MSEVEREKYKNNLICIECGKNAFYKRPAKDGKKACFAARHVIGCKQSSTHRGNYSEGKEEVSEINLNTSFFEVSWNYVNSFKNRVEGDNYETSYYSGKNIKKNIKKSAIQKNMKISLYQILKFAEYNVIKDQDIVINLLHEFKLLKDVVLHMKEISDNYLDSYNFYWGKIHNFNENWLNTDYDNKISILIDNAISKKFWDLYKKRLYKVLKNNSFIVFGKVKKTKNDNYYIIVKDLKKLYFRKSRRP